AVFYIYNKSNTFYIQDPSSIVHDPTPGGAQYVVFVNALGATLNLFAQGQVVWQAGLLNAGTVEVQGFSSGTTLTLSGGEGRALSGVNWTGGTLGDGGGSITVGGTSTTSISGSAEHLLAAPYTLILNGTSCSGSYTLSLHDALPISAVFYIYNKSNTFYIQD